MAWSLTHVERAQVRKAFLEIDTANEGTISLLEMKEVLEKNFSLPSEQIHHIFKALDSNNDGIINYSEFLAAMMSTRLRMHDNLLCATFRRFDKDGSGTINIEDFKTVLGEDQNIDLIMSEVDGNADGKISYEEFIAYLHKTDGEEGFERLQSVATKVIDKEIQNREDGTLVYPEPQTPEQLRKRDKLKQFAVKYLGGF